MVFFRYLAIKCETEVRLLPLTNPRWSWSWLNHLYIAYIIPLSVTRWCQILHTASYEITKQINWGVRRDRSVVPNLWVKSELLRDDQGDGKEKKKQFLLHKHFIKTTGLILNNGLYLVSFSYSSLFYRSKLLQNCTWVNVLWHWMQHVREGFRYK